MPNGPAEAAGAIPSGGASLVVGSAAEPARAISTGFSVVLTTPPTSPREVCRAAPAPEDTASAFEQSRCASRPARSWLAKSQEVARNGGGRLDLVGARLSETSVAEVQDFALWLGQDATISDLVLCWNSLGDRCAQALAAALRENWALLRLDLSLNSLHEAGAWHIASALRENCTLVELHLGCNAVGDNGARHLARALRVNASLRALVLDDNGIGEDGAQLLSKALRTDWNPSTLFQSSLRVLTLASNHIGEAGARHLGDAVADNTALQVLDLSNNYVGQGGAHWVVSAVRNNATLVMLDLSCNNISEPLALRQLERCSEARLSRTLILEDSDLEEAARTARDFDGFVPDAFASLEVGVGPCVELRWQAKQHFLDAATGLCFRRPSGMMCDGAAFPDELLDEVDWNCALAEAEVAPMLCVF